MICNRCAEWFQPPHLVFISDNNSSNPLFCIMWNSSTVLQTASKMTIRMNLKNPLSRTESKRYCSAVWLFIYSPWHAQKRLLWLTETLFVIARMELPESAAQTVLAGSENGVGQIMSTHHQMLTCDLKPLDDKTLLAWVMEIGKSRRPAADSWMPLPINSERMFTTSTEVQVQSLIKYIVINQSLLALL